MSSPTESVADDVNSISVISSSLQQETLQQTPPLALLAVGGKIKGFGGIFGGMKVELFCGKVENQSIFLLLLN